jgi:MFS family permease
VTDDYLVDQEQAKRICCIPVKEGVSFWNMMAIPLVPCIVMLVCTFVNAQSIFLLRDPEYFDVDEDDLGKISSLLILVALPGAMMGTFAGGYIFDIVGRRMTLFSCFFGGSLMVFIIPYTSPNVVPGLLLVRIMITFSTASPASNPLLADYVHKDAIGKAAALIGLGFIVGEVLSMAILFPLTENLSRENAFMTVAIVGAASSFLFLFKEP